MAVPGCRAQGAAAFFGLNSFDTSTMKNSIPISGLARGAAALAFALALAPLAGAQKLAYRASIDGAQEVPPTGSPAKGTASVVVDLDANTLTFDLTYTGLGSAETMAHIHGPAPAGVNAGIKFNLALGNKKTGVWNYPQSDENDILNGQMYFNVHSTTFGGGEVRGQIVRDQGLVVMSATLNGAQEVPPTPSAGVGTGHVSIDTVANLLSFELTYHGLTSAETMAHIHGPAPAGVNAGIKLNLPLGSTKFGVWGYPQADEAAILAGMMYFNVHTVNFGGGEIRGQILPLATNPTSYCTGKVSSLGCTPGMSGSGKPSASLPNGFVASSSPVPGGNVGIFFYSIVGPAAIPFQGGTMCVQPPIIRTPFSTSGGTVGLCNGVYSIDFNAYIQSGFDPALVAGTRVNLQNWFRDPPAPFGSGLSNGLMFDLWP
jgi:hypothetical protein